MRTPPLHRGLLLLAAAALLLPPAPPILAGEEASLEAIGTEGLLGHLRLLASDEWEGRGTGSPGEEKATAYIAARFAEWGLEPLGEQGGYFQRVPIADGFTLGPGCALVSSGVDGVPDVFAVGTEFTPFGSSASATVEGEAIFAGYGLSLPDAKYDDYEGLDVAGKVVVVFRHAPHGIAEGARGTALFRRAAFSSKLEEAQKRGAAALVVVNDPYNFPATPGTAADGSRRLPDALHSGETGGGRGKIPFVHLTLAAGRRLFAQIFGATPEACEASIHEDLAAAPAPRPVPRPGKGVLRLVTAVEPRLIHGRNVCGLLRAGAPDAIDEVLVVGAHHDHLGRGAPGTLARTPEERRQIHNGADDNASGTTGLLEIARALAPRRDRLRRSVLFLTFTGEERGLLGSLHWVEHPTLPLARVAAMVNMDMIGRLDGRKLFVGGVGTSPAFRLILEEGRAAVGLEVAYGDGGRAPSDNTSFYAKGIPVLFFFTGLHDDYHRPSDDIERVDLAAMAKVASYAARTSLALANLPDRPVFVRADQGGFGPPRVVLGISAGVDAAGVKIEGLAPGGAAEAAGLRPGDVIVALGGEATPDLGALGALLRKREAGQRTTVRVVRDGVARDVEVTLGQG